MRYLYSEKKYLDELAAAAVVAGVEEQDWIVIDTGSIVAAKYLVESPPLHFAPTGTWKITIMTFVAAVAVDCIAGIKFETEVGYYYYYC